MKDKIVEMLGAGVSAVQVALACGVSESYVSQLLADEEVAAAVAAQRVERAQQHVQHDSDLDTDEELARKKVRANLQSGLLKPMEILRHFQILNAARRKSDTGLLGGQTPQGTTVHLHLPQAAVVEFKLTVDRQVVEVDGRSMTPMPAHMVAKALREKKASEMLQLSVSQPTTIEAPNILRELVDARSPRDEHGYSVQTIREKAIDTAGTGTSFLNKPRAFSESRIATWGKKREAAVQEVLDQI